MTLPTRPQHKNEKLVSENAPEEIAPESSEELLRAVQESSMGGESDLDSTLLEALVECYHNADHWSNRRQILSIIADKVSFTTLQKWIPGISRY